jgi:Cu2+-containing amine oxidase
VGRRILVVFFSLALLMTASFALPPKVHHPLDALTPDEYWTIYRALRDAGHVKEQTVFTSVLLHEPPKREGESVQDMSLQHPAMWRFVNHTARDPYGYPTGFEIMPGVTAASLLPDTEWPQKRAGFSSHQLWVTPYDPAEFFASGTYLLSSKGTDALPEWVKKNRSRWNGLIAKSCHITGICGQSSGRGT